MQINLSAGFAICNGCQKLQEADIVLNIPTAPCNPILSSSSLHKNISEMQNQYQSTIRQIKQTKKHICEQEDYAKRYGMELALCDRAEHYRKEYLGSDTILKLKT